MNLTKPALPEPVGVMGMQLGGIHWMICDGKAAHTAVSKDSTTAMMFKPLETGVFLHTAEQMLYYADQCTAAAQARIDALTKDLRFVERWAVYHGSKSRITPQEVLSTIQHYPPIKDITRSYADGVVPETFDPWARIAELEGAILRYYCERGLHCGTDLHTIAARLTDALASTSGAEPKPWPQEVQPNGSVWPINPDDVVSTPVEPLSADAACAWTWQEGDEVWATSCGNMFALDAGTPKDNGMRWCCYCGGALDATAGKETS
jgi:hypothetical protein